MVSKKDSVKIGRWMITELGLHGKELMAYAIIYGFSRGGAGAYYRGRSYIAEWLGCSAKTAGNVLASLTRKGLIEREEIIDYRGRFFAYRVTNVR